MYLPEKIQTSTIFTPFSKDKECVWLTVFTRSDLRESAAPFNIVWSAGCSYSADTQPWTLDSLSASLNGYPRHWHCLNTIQSPKWWLEGISSVFQITFKGRVPTRSFEGSIDVSLPTPSQVNHWFCRVRWPAFSGFWPETPLLSGPLLIFYCSAPSKLSYFEKVLGVHSSSVHTVK